MSPKTFYRLSHTDVVRLLKAGVEAETHRRVADIAITVCRGNPDPVIRVLVTFRADVVSP